MSLHPSLLDIVADPRMTVRVPPPDIPFPVIRKAANAAMATGARPDIAQVSDHVIDAPSPVPIRVYRPTDRPDAKVILFCHGGGFVWGSLDTHDGLCRRMAAHTGANIVSVDYRLSPEAPFPAAESDLAAVVDAVLTGTAPVVTAPERLTLCGDSAGGYLAFIETIRLVRAGQRPARLGLIYPALDPSCSGESHANHSNGPILTTEAMRWFWSCHAPPIQTHTEHLNAFPSTCILVAGHDPLRDDGIGLHDALHAAGVGTSLIEAPDMVHGFLSLPMPETVVGFWETQIFDALT